MVTRSDECLGEIGPFEVDVPWWAEVAPVVSVLERELGVPVTVLRLLSVEGSDGARDGHVTYHVEASARPSRPLRAAVFRDPPEPLRLPWATREGITGLLDWAAGFVTLTGRAVQHKSWNLAALFRLPTAAGPVWLKATPPFAADEATAIATIAAVDPTLVPEVLAAAPGRLLLADIPGEDLWQASDAQVTSTVSRWVAAQAALATGPAGNPDFSSAGLRDGRPSLLAARIEGLLVRLAPELPAETTARARALNARWAALSACGLPDTLVHGDFHPGNWRGTPGSPPRVIDFADAYWGNPVQDGLRAIDYLPGERRDTATAAWVGAWREHAPGADPERALTLGEPLAHLAYAVRYQEFLDGIEPDERIYHDGDPAASIRHALAC
ncbi:aminoglycoside phosphotransferase family protein [Cryptosporangium sp. NPDC051539]|uniref:aminoglycoside phosphotransferase family protein n=1 Tax=Cryptosporangium sp. NPDC051539 TaxID=3363962 RepID=UPI00379B0E3F